jgi:hypothetical protein
MVRELRHSLFALKGFSVLLINIIIWLSLLLLLVPIPFTAKPAGLDPPIFCRQTPNWLWKINSQTFFFNFTEKLQKIEFFFGNFFLEFFLGLFLKIFMKTRSVAISES